MKRIAVVGGTAALCLHLLPVLRWHAEVITLGRRDCDIHCDLAEPLENIHFPEGTDVVVHVAAGFAGGTDTEILEMVQTNVLGTLKICMAARRAGVKHVIVLSSVSAAFEIHDDYYDHYSISKKQADELALHYCSKHRVPLTILRPSQLFSEYEAFREHQPLWYVFADQAQSGKNLNIYGGNDALRNYLYAGDLACIIQGVVDCGIQGVFTCTYPMDYPLSEVARAALEAFGGSGRVVFLKDKPDIPDNVFGHEAELYDRLGFMPGVDVAEGMKRLAECRKGERAS